MTDDAIEVSVYLDGDDLAQLADELDVPVSEIMGLANSTRLDEAAHYATLEKLRYLVQHRAQS